MRTLVLTFLWALSAGCLAGCKVQYTHPATQPARLTAAEANFEAVWQGSRSTLQRYHFEIGRQDRRAGVIATLPMTGMHFFEFWRKDAARPTDFGESTIQTVYRTAQVTIRPVKGRDGTYEATVEVLLSRSNRPRAHVTSTSEAYSLFRTGGRDRRRRGPLLEDDPRGPARDYLTDLGHDRGLEAKLTADIAAAAGKLRGAAPLPREEVKPAPKRAAGGK